MRPRPCVFVLIMVLMSGSSLLAQVGGYGGMYDYTPPVSVPTVGPTPTPEPGGRLSLSLSYNSTGGMRGFPAVVSPGSVVEIWVRFNMIGGTGGHFKLSALLLNSSGGTLSPTRRNMSAGGDWNIRFHAGETPGRFPILVVAQDPSGNYPSTSVMGTVEVRDDEPKLLTPQMGFSPVADTAETRIRNRSWIMQLHMRNFVHPYWRENLAEDIVNSHGWKATIADAVKIDRDRLNIQHRLPPKEQFRSYTKLEPLMSRYWADTGITVAGITGNQIGDVFVQWRSQPELVIDLNSSIGRELVLDTRPVKIGRILNAVGGAMILLDFWSNMASAGNPAEAREAWYKAGYSSLDLTLANVVGETFGAAAALPGMMVSYILTNSYDTLIGGYKSCWFKKMVIQAMDADYLSEDIHDTRAVEKVKTAMLSPGGLEGALMTWWKNEAPTWGAKMGGCGNWNLAEARGYRKEFVKRLMKTSEVEVNGRRVHPWSFYYSVSRMIVLDKKKELAREAAENMARIEAAYISELAGKTYVGNFQLMSSSVSPQPLAGVLVCLAETEGGGSCEMSWTTDQEGRFTIRLPGHRFSPQHRALLSVSHQGKSYLFIVPDTAFTEVVP